MPPFPQPIIANRDLLILPSSELQPGDVFILPNMVGSCVVKVICIVKPADVVRGRFCYSDGFESEEFSIDIAYKSNLFVLRKRVA